MPANVPIQYVEFEIETDPEDIAQLAYDYMEANFPGFTASKGNLETFLIGALSHMITELRDVAAEVPIAIFRYFGNSVANIPPLDFSSAFANSTWTMKDTLGYTIEQGTVVAMPTQGDELEYFETETEVVVPAGSIATLTGQVALTAIDPGSQANGLNNPTLVDVHEGVVSITLTGDTSGGVDAEADEDYLDRLSSELQLMAPRPIIASDFAILARRIAGVFRACALDNYHPGTDEIQTATVSGASSGNVTLTFSGQTTANIPWNATFTQVQTALENLSNINVGDILCSGGPLNNTVTIAFTATGQYAKQDVAQITATNIDLNAGTVGTATATPGVGPTTNNERMVTVSCITEAGEVVSTPIFAEVQAYLDLLRELNFVVWTVAPKYTTINIVYAVKAFVGSNTADIKTQIDADLALYRSPANWGVITDDGHEWINDNKFRYLSVAEVILGVQGVKHIETLTVNGGTVDVTMTGDIALPREGTTSGTVTT